MTRSLPSGEVTFAFTDVVGSTVAFAEHGPGFVQALGRVQSIVAEHAERNGGAVVKSWGTARFWPSASAPAALRALTDVQRGLAAPWEGVQLSLRAGAHSGLAEPFEGDYFALDVHVAAGVGSRPGPDRCLFPVR